MKKAKQNLILESSPRVFQVELACAVGLYGAVMLQQLHYWLQRSNNVVEGHVWVYNSYSRWQSEGGLEFRSPKQIRVTLTKLEKTGLVVSANFNKFKADKTKWYRIDYDKLYSLCPFGQTQSPNGQTDMTEWADLFTQMGRPIPENTPKTTTVDKEDIPTNVGIVATPEEAATLQRKVELNLVNRQATQLIRHLEESVGVKVKRDGGNIDKKQRGPARVLIRRYGLEAVCDAIDRAERTELTKPVSRWRVIEGVLHEAGNNV